MDLLELFNIQGTLFLMILVVTLVQQKFNKESLI